MPFSACSDLHGVNPNQKKNPPILKVAASWWVLDYKAGFSLLGGNKGIPK